METTIPPKDRSNQEICSIRIMFPVNSDEEAIAYKKKLVPLLAEIPDAQIHFSLMSDNKSGSPIQ